MKTLRAILLLFVLGYAGPAFSQGGVDAFARARRLVNDGDARAGRAVVDSMLAAAAPNSPAYAEALYWRGVLAENGEAARTDLLRVAIEFPLSPQSGDALLRLAQLEFTRGDRAAALRHLDQLAREHPDAPARAAGRYWTARVLLEDAKPVEACAALRDAQRLAPASDVELVNQIAYYARSCGAVATTVDSSKTIADSRKTSKTIADSRKTSKTIADSRKTIDSEQGPIDRSQTTTAKGKWSVQVAAYGDRDTANGLVRRLKARGLEARVTTDKPWRVRVGHYATRAEAAEVAKRLGSKRAPAMVVEAEKR